MPYYSNEIVEQVLAANDIVDVISRYVPLTQKGNEFVGLCPFHNDNNPSFNVSRGKQLYLCRACHAKGNVYTFMKEYHNLTFPEALKELADMANIRLPEQEMTQVQKRAYNKRMQLLEVHKKAAEYYYRLLRAPEGKHALNYFYKRGLTDETIRRFGLGYAGRSGPSLYRYLKAEGYGDSLLKDSGLVLFDEKRGAYDRFWNRAMFPIMDLNRKVIGFGGRVMGDGMPKYLNSPESGIFDKSRNLYGYQYARGSRRRGILLCEGYMDVIALHQAGFDNAVASLGTSFTDGQASLLRRYKTNTVYLTFDSDSAGHSAALRAIPILDRAGIQTKVVSMDPYKDPDEFIKAEGAERFQERIDRAENSFMFELRMSEERYNMSDPGERSAFFRSAVRRVAERFEDSGERDEYLREIGRVYGKSYQDLVAQMKKLASSEVALGRSSVPPAVTNMGKEKKEDDRLLVQRRLITWMSDPADRQQIRQYIAPEDFSDPVCRELAEYILPREDAVVPGAVVEMFDEDQHDAVTAAFQADLPSLRTDRERKKAIFDHILTIRTESMKRFMAQAPEDSMEFREELRQEKRKLDNLKQKVREL